MTARVYVYVGPAEIRERVRDSPPGRPVRELADVRAFAAERGVLGPGGAFSVTVTFVVTTAGLLQIADRRSEHVACAGGEPVLGAGELTVESGGASRPVEVTMASNQSTGYCPEPECWAAVAAALDGASIQHPGDFTWRVTFRRCPGCGERNLVKDGWFECALCGSALPAAWNF